MNLLLIFSLLLIAFGVTVNGDTCTMTVAEKRDCGNITTTPEGCVASGCCWEVTHEPTRPNCFFKKSDVVTTIGPQTTSGPLPGNKKVYVHMMPWFESNVTYGGGKWGIHWTMDLKNPDKYVDGKRDIASHYHPLIDIYASGDSKVIDWQLGLMKLSGISGILIDWPGTTKAWDYPTNMLNCEAIINGTARHGLEFAIVYEDHNLGMAHDAHKIEDVIEQGKADMAYLQANYMSKSNYIQFNDAPLLLDFGPITLHGTQYADIFTPFTKKPTFLTLWGLMQDVGGSAQGEFAWVYQNYLEGLSNFYKYRDIKLKFGAAYPGFNGAYDIGGWPGPTWKIPVGLDTFQQTLDLALNYTDNVQLVTWNDYGEGTMIEPTDETGYGFLTILQKKLNVKYTQADLEKVTDLYHRKVLNANNPTMLAQLENEHFDLVNN